MAIPTCRSFAILGLGVEQVTEPCGTLVFVGVFEKMFMFVVFGSFEIAVIILVLVLKLHHRMSILRLYIVLV